MAAPLLLVAASGLAREVLALLREQGEREVLGFLDDDPGLVGRDVDGLPVLGGIDDVARWPAAELVVCAGRGSARRSVVERLTRAGVTPERYATVVHPGVSTAGATRIGRGTILLAGVVLTTAVEIGDHVVVMPHVTLTHDDVVQDYATLCAGVALGGWVRVGPGAYLGMSSAVRERVSVGAGATLGMGSALLEDLPAGQVWVGTPARPITTRAR
ncbi:NeuD/PglB/VioB family sugar acetyltransferase [Cellulomonas citrea]|uniref:NeuD/PglB/VioB family sugar acetyltransferase n=1 Tax=Cellulomonas citrea TaxID=1909423 RepID=UPI0013574251|nr:NeuD/PglB/VioB family sugar acetyltransferase [Cellulomonas citrea]